LIAIVVNRVIVPFPSVDSMTPAFLGECGSGLTSREETGSFMNP
jgi:hypothetical protein